MTNTKEETREGLICKIGKKYMYGSIDLTNAIEEIKQEAKKEFLELEGKVICRKCGNVLTNNNLSYNWVFKNGKIWFCGISCATAFAVEEILRSKK